jgi:hypothetical protein
MLGLRECKPLPLQQPGDNRTPGPPLAHYASVAHVARVYDYLLGGKDNFAADREAAEQAMQINPSVVPPPGPTGRSWPAPPAT